MFRTGLTWQQYQLFGAVPVVVHLDDELKPLLLELTESEVGNLHLANLLLGEDDTC